MSQEFEVTLILILILLSILDLVYYLFHQTLNANEHSCRKYQIFMSINHFSNFDIVTYFDLHESFSKQYWIIQDFYIQYYYFTFQTVLYDSLEILFTNNWNLSSMNNFFALSFSILIHYYVIFYLKSPIIQSICLIVSSHFISMSI